MITAKARVQVTLEVEVASWGGDWTIEKFYKSAAESGVQDILFACQASKNKFKVIGQPKVIGVITE